MGQVRIHGDPFGEDGAARLLRSFLRLALAGGVRCSLSLAAVEVRPGRPGERAIALTDGGAPLLIATRLPPAEIELLLRAAGTAVAATVPIVVFAPADRRADAVRAAGLAWPQATSVAAARDGATAVELLERVRAETRWAGREDPLHALDERELLPWLQLPALFAADRNGPIVAVGDGTFASGLDLAIALWRRHFARSGRRLRVVVDGAATAALQAALGDDAAGAEVLAASFQPEHVRDAAAVLLPFRRLPSSRLLVQALASGRPVCVSRFAATAPLLAAAGICLPIGGHNVPDDAEPAHFAPSGEAMLAALQHAVDDVAAADAIGVRARCHVLTELTRDRPCAPPSAVPKRPDARPLLVLEAPFFAAPPLAEVAIATAQALVRRDHVDVQLVTTVPLPARLADLGARAPELLSRFCRDPGVADLWLSCGTPVRAARPRCRSWAIAVDPEYGALPLELTPHVTQDADTVVVPGEHAQRTLTGAGRSAASVQLVPHGVCAEMHAGAAADPGIVAWKQGRPAVLFCGNANGLDGIDVFLRAVLGVHRAGATCVVVALLGHGRQTGGLDLGEQLERFRQTNGAPPLLAIDRELSRAELAAIYAACDVMLHPHRGGAFRLPVLEARACGLPVLATAGGAMATVMVGPGAIGIPATRRDVQLAPPHAGATWVLEPSAAAAERLLAATLADLPAHRRAARAHAAAVGAAFAWDTAAAEIEALAFAGMAKRYSGMAGSEPAVTLSRAPVAPQLEPART